MNVTFETGGDGGTATTHDWLTPPEILEALGPFDMDPCASQFQPWRTATQQFTIEDSHVEASWLGWIARASRGKAPAVESVPVLPDFDTVEQHIYGACRRYITQDMLEPIHNLIRDAIDADRTARASAESAERDAERYRWLRRWKGQEHEPPFTVQHELDGTLWGGDLDAAIDAARAQAKEGAIHE